MSTKILNLQLGYCPHTIQCLIVTKDTKTDKQKFLALCKDSTDEITICFDKQFYNRVKIGCVYQISGFSKQISTRYILTKFILYTSFNLKICDIQSPKVTIEYLSLPKEHNILFISTPESITALASNVIVNLKAKFIGAVVRQDHFLLTIEVGDMSYTVRVKHVKNLTHLKKGMCITLKRVETYKKNSYDSVLFCSTMFTQIFESETILPEQNNSQVSDIEVPINEILDKGIINKRYKKHCKVLYSKFISFYNICSKCSTKYTNYNPMDCGTSENGSEAYCGSCSFPIDRYCYVVHLELTVVEASDVNANAPFTIVLFERIAEKILKNTGRNIRKKLDEHCAQDVEDYLLGKVLNNFYEFTIHLPYVNEKFDAVYKRFYAVDVKLTKLSKDGNNNETGIQIDDDIEKDTTNQEEMHGLMLNSGDGDTSASAAASSMENINNHNEIPSDLCELVEDEADTCTQLTTEVDVTENTVKHPNKEAKEEDPMSPALEDTEEDQQFSNSSDEGVSDNPQSPVPMERNISDEIVEESPNDSDDHIHRQKRRNATNILKRKRRIDDDEDNSNDIASTSANTNRRHTKKK